MRSLLSYKPITYYVRFKWKSDSYIVREAGLFPGDRNLAGRDDSKTKM